MSYKQEIENYLVTEKRKGHFLFALGSRNVIGIRIRKFHYEDVIMDDSFLKNLCFGHLPFSLLSPIMQLCRMNGVIYDKRNLQFYIKVDLTDTHDLQTKLCKLLSVLVGVDALLLTVNDAGDNEVFDYRSF